MTTGEQLNYHHLRAFRAIAREGGVTQASARLRVAASALSRQLRELEDALGCRLFERTGRRMELTEAGSTVLQYADAIFGAGDELVASVGGVSVERGLRLTVGSVATLSRNFQLAFIRPALERPDVSLALRSGSLRELLVQLESHALDVVLSHLPVRTDLHQELTNHLLDEQPAHLVGAPGLRLPGRAGADGLAEAPLILPGRETGLRQAFDAWAESEGFRPRIVAEADDMAMLRLLARSGIGFALTPRVVVVDELEDHHLEVFRRLPRLTERFFAITRRRLTPHPILKALLERWPRQSLPSTSGGAVPKSGGRSSR